MRSKFSTPSNKGRRLLLGGIGLALTLLLLGDLPLVVVRATGTPVIMMTMADTANATTYATWNQPDYIAIANTLYVLAIVHSDAAGETTVPTIGDTTGLNWVQCGASVFFDTIASPSHGLHLFRAMKASGLGTGIITITFADASTGAAAMLVSVEGTDTTGTDGSGASVQCPTNVANATANPNLTFAAYGAADNMVLSFVGTDTQTAVAVTDWTEMIGTTDYAAPTTQLFIQYKVSTDTTSTSTLVASHWGANGLEIKTAAAGASTLRGLLLGVGPR